MAFLKQSLIQDIVSLFTLYVVVKEQQELLSGRLGLLRTCSMNSAEGYLPGSAAVGAFGPWGGCCCFKIWCLVLGYLVGGLSLPGSCGQGDALHQYFHALQVDS